MINFGRIINRYQPNLFFTGIMAQVSLFGKLKKYLYDTMEVPASEDRQGLVYELFMSVLIVFNAIAMILGTVGSIQQEYDWILAPFEYFSLVIFSVEYILLLWVCTESPAFSDPVRGRIRYMLTPVALINLLSVLPAFKTVNHPTRSRDFPRTSRL